MVNGSHNAGIQGNPRRRLFLASMLSAFMLAAAVAFGAPESASADPCPNEAIRAAQTSPTLPQGSTVLPACMGLEMVTPPQKFNQGASAPNFSANGDRVAFQSIAALADTPALNSIGDTYVATRTESGWTTRPTALPSSFPGGAGLPFPHSCTFSPDLSRFTTWASLASQLPLSITTPFRVSLDGSYVPLSPTLIPLSGGDPFAVFNGGCEGGSVDSSTELLNFSLGTAQYLPGDPKSASNVYIARLDTAGNPSVSLLARAEGQVYGGGCGTVVAGETEFPQGGATSTVFPRRGTVSPDASRIYFTARPSESSMSSCNPAANRSRIMVRRETPTGPQISELISSECTRAAPPCSSADTDDRFLGASQEGTRVYFETDRQLTDSDLDATTDLYLYDATKPGGERLTQVSAGDSTDPTPGEGARLLGLGDFSGDGSHAYFVARGVLTTAPNSEGNTAQSGQPNLYLYERDASHPAGRTAFIGTLTEALFEVQRWAAGPSNGNKYMAVPRLGGDLEDQSGGGDGHDLLFETEASLTADDLDGNRTDLYRYDSSSGALERISRSAPGGQDNGAFDVSSDFPFGATRGPQAVSFRRPVSEDGSTVVFSTAEALDPADTNGVSNAYMWRDGRVTALPFATFPTVSMSGAAIAFQATAPLLPQDGDTVVDVYVARVDGGFSQPPPPTPCQGESCQGPPASQPSGEGPGSALFRGEGNRPSPRAKCRKSQVRRHGKCVKRRHAKRHRQQKKTSKRASHKHGGRK